MANYADMNRLYSDGRSVSFRGAVIDPFIRRIAHQLMPNYMAERSDRMLGVPLSRLFDHEGTAFIHIPKTAGTSVSFALYGAQIPHCTYFQLRHHYPRQSQRWKYFAIVRDPIDRFLSALNFTIAGGIHPETIALRAKFLGRDVDPNRFVKALLNPFSESPLSNILFQPQISFLVDEEGRQVVNDVFPMNNLNERLEEYLGKKVVLPTLNTGEKMRISRSDLSRASLEILNQVYSLDRELYQASVGD